MYKLNPKFVPYPHQLEGVEYSIEHKYLLNADEPGLGKTLQSVMLANYTGLPTLVICPAYLKYNWVKEINQLCAETKNISVFKTTNDIYAAMGTEVLDDFIIINGEQLKHCEHLFRWAKLLVIDEVHHYKSITAQRSIFLEEFLYNHPPERFLMLTGTPIHNRVIDLYNLLAMLSYDQSGTNGISILDKFPTFEQFCEHFANKRRVQIKTRRGTVSQIVYDGLKNVEELHTYLEGKFIRRLQKDVLDLPPIQFIDVLVSYKENKKLLQEYLAFTEGDGERVDISVKAKVRSAVLKAKFTAQYAQDILETGSSVVIYSAHRDSAKIIADSIEGCVYIDGSVAPEKRQDIVDAFQRGEIMAISATIGAGSTGFTLTASQDLIFNDKDWLNGENDQALRRIYRIGQTKRCRIHNIYGSPQDQYIGNKLQEKMEVTNAVLQEG